MVGDPAMISPRDTRRALSLLARCVEDLAGLTSYAKDHAIACAINEKLAELRQILK